MDKLFLPQKVRKNPVIALVNDILFKYCSLFYLFPFGSQKSLMASQVKFAQLVGKFSRDANVFHILLQQNY